VMTAFTHTSLLGRVRISAVLANARVIRPNCRSRLAAFHAGYIATAPSKSSACSARPERLNDLRKTRPRNNSGAAHCRTA